MTDRNQTFRRLCANRRPLASIHGGCMNRMKIALTAVALLTAPWLSGQNRKPDSAEVQLQAAIHAEMVDGKFKEAIEQYRKLVQTNDRAIAAKALLRMAECYQKLGDKESRKIYEQLLRDFS